MIEKLSLTVKSRGKAEVHSVGGFTDFTIFRYFCIYEESARPHGICLLWCRWFPLPFHCSYPLARARSIDWMPNEIHITHNLFSWWATGCGGERFKTCILVYEHTYIYICIHAYGCERVWREWRNCVIRILLLTHDSHIFVNIRPRQSPFDCILPEAEG